jgi:class 3 adenylate cyclase
VARCSACLADVAEGARFCSECGARLDQAPAVEERRLVTILFADLAGSTAMGERLDPEDVREIQRTLYELSVAELGRYGGIAEKFIGDAVVAVFGAPRAHEDDAERAVRAGLAIMSAFEALRTTVREQHDVEIALRIGIDSGEVVSGRDAVARGELMVSGDAVNSAARLQQAAEPGEVLCGERVVLATGGPVSYGASREVRAHGKSAPVEARPALGVVAVPQGRAAAARRAPLVGRAGELELLETVANRALDARVPQLITLYGPAGIGKSRLLAELAASRPDAMLIEGPCLPYGDGITWWPLAEIARHLAGIRESDARDHSCRLLDEALAGLVDDETADAIAYTIGLEGPGSPTAALGTGAVPRVMRAAWARLVTALGRRGPCIVAIEDIHWAADALLDLLEHLAGTLEDCAVLLVCPARHELLERRPGWGAGLRNHTAIDLRPLAPAAAAELLDALLPDTNGNGRADILDRAGGNPFYTEEIVRMLRDRGEAHGGIPDTVRAVIAARIDLLGDRERAALLASSVVGATFWAEAVGADPDALDALARRDLVREQDDSSFDGLREFAFRHALTREVAYAGLSRPARRELHLRVATFIEHEAPGREAEFRDLIAHHYEQAIRAGEDRCEIRAAAVEHLLAAGVGALRRGGTHAARRTLEFAYDLGEARSCEAGLLLGETLIVLDELDAAQTVLEASYETFQERGDRERAADALGWLSRVHWREGHRVEAVDAARRAVEQLEGCPESRTVAHALARRAQLASLGAEPAARPLSLEALGVAERVGDAASVASSMASLLVANANARAVSDFARTQEALAIALGAGATEEATRAVINHVWNAANEVPLAELDAQWQHLVPPVAAIEGATFMIGYGFVSHALFVLYPQGRLDEAAAVIADPTYRATVSMSAIIPWVELEARLAALRGDVLRARSLMRGMLEAADRVGETQRVSRMRGVAAVLAALAGDGGSVREHLGVALTSQRGLECAPQRIDLAIDAARSAGRLGDAACLGGIHAEIDPYLAQYGVPGAVAARALLAGSLAEASGDHLAAAAGYELARRTFEERGARLPAALAGLSLATVLAESGDAGGAVEARTQADAVLLPLGVVNPI